MHLPSWIKSLNFFVLLGAVLGIGLGTLSQTALIPFKNELTLIATLSGTLFIACLNMVIMPLVFLTVSASILHLRNLNKLHRIWNLTATYIVGCALVASATGLIFVNWIKPGFGLNISMFATQSQLITQTNPTELFISFIKTSLQNPISAIMNQNVLSLVVFAIFLGIGLLSLGEKAKKLSTIIDESATVFMWMIQKLIRLAPIGIFGLLYQLASTQNIALFQQVGLFILVVFAATLWHGFINLPAILFIFTKKNPYRILWASQQPLLTAFSTSSSSATLPVTLDTVQNKLNLNPNTSTFVASIGATLNMDGTALYEAMAALFIANIMGVHLSLTSQCLIILMASLASIGAPGIPSAGMVTMIMVLQTVGLPAEAIAILLPMDRLLDTVRTMVNVEGDIIGSVIVDHNLKDLCKTTHNGELQR